MKLSDLVKARQLLLAYVSPNRIRDEIDAYIHSINDVRSTVLIGVDIDSDLLDINDTFIDRKRDILDASTKIYDVIAKLDNKIAAITKDYFARGYKINDCFATNRSNVEFERTSRQLPISEEAKQKVISRIQVYSDWHYPGLEIGPGDGQWTSHLVANDPLYIVDIEKEFLDATAFTFSPEYRLRLRAYLIDWTKSETDLSMLPQNQFGFVFSWNVFNYFPLDMIKQYLLHIWEVLRPGGVCMFSYNDGENPFSILRVEDGSMSYMPKSMLISLCKSLNFEIIELHDEDEAISWIEIKKPGTLHTIKAHQTLGKIEPLK
jgi:SAM-dependent methyltransferase